MVKPLRYEIAHDLEGGELLRVKFLAADPDGTRHAYVATAQLPLSVGAGELTEIVRALERDVRDRAELDGRELVNPWSLTE